MNKDEHSPLLKTIVVEDEPMALELMVDYIEKVKRLELIGSFRNGLLALDFLKQNKVDLIFLDINMPDLSGIELANLLEESPQIIFTTAYSEYAIEGFDLNAVDYLLKPISFARFLKACDRAIEKKRTTTVKSEAHSRKFLLIKSGTETHKVFQSDILFIEGSGNYVTYHTTKGKLMSLQTMKELEAQLEPPFVRAHKSYIINLDYLTSFESHQLSIGKTKIPISQAYKLGFLQDLENEGRTKQ